MDAAGKDGTIRSVLTCLSPHDVHEVAFKAPSSDELAHDFLWRIVKQVPTKGENHRGMSCRRITSGTCGIWSAKFSATR